MPHIIVPAALAILRGAESCRLAAYPDPGSGGEPWTIGWGHTGPDVRRGLIWTQAQCDAQLQQDVAEHADQIAHAIGSEPTTDNQFGAMVSLAFNIGIGNFARSSVLGFHLRGLHHNAAEAFAGWDKAGGRVLPGLVRRRAAEAALYLNPDVAAVWA